MEAAHFFCKLSNRQLGDHRNPFLQGSAVACIGDRYAEESLDTKNLEIIINNVSHVKACTFGAKRRLSDDVARLLLQAHIALCLCFHTSQSTKINPTSSHFYFSCIFEKYSYFHTFCRKRISKFSVLSCTKIRLTNLSISNAKPF